MSDEIQKPNIDSKFYWTFFKATFMISALTFGGGYVIIALMKSKFVDEYHWLDEKKTLDIVAVAQSTPGIMAVNTSIMIGYELAGILGAVTGILATVLPPLLVIGVVAKFYDVIASNEYVRLALKGMQCGATALLVNVAIDLLKKQLTAKLILPIVIIIGTFIANLFFDVNIMLLVLIDGIIGLIFMRSKIYG